MAVEVYSHPIHPLHTIVQIITSSHIQAREISALTPPSTSTAKLSARACTETRVMALTLPVYVPNQPIPPWHLLPHRCARMRFTMYTANTNTAQRGGVGNIGSPRVRPTSKVPHDSEMIPELAVRGSTDENYHVGVCTVYTASTRTYNCNPRTLAKYQFYSAAAKATSTSTRQLARKRKRRRPRVRRMRDWRIN